ncbi:porin family protein [Croceibacterium salegens]|uniref:hypothetical protein n=1 Tax=Croceibacterium salegens TaxID=1737568 RepID=UPI000AFF9B2C|nr:hypothetical protein [Croceibacterium salegens]
MRLHPATSLAALAVALSTPAFAQSSTPVPDADSTVGKAQDGLEQMTPEQRQDLSDNEILVIAGSLRGAVEAPQPAVVELNEEDIASYGAGSLAELVAALSAETGSGRGRGGGQPVFLLNGLRVSSFREMRSFPPEAIRKVEILPEEVAQRYGYPPNQRVINFILKDNFSSKEVELEYEQPDRGGTSTKSADGTLLTINGASRLNIDLNVSDTSKLTEAERGIAQTVAPVVTGDPDQAPYRTLVADSENYQLTANWTKGLGDAGASLSLNGTLSRNDSTSLSGLNTVLLTGPTPPGDSELRIFGADDPLARRSRTDNAAMGATLNANAGDWQLTGTLDASRNDSTTKIDRRADVAGLQTAALTGAFGLDDPITIPTAAGFDTANSMSDSASAKFTAIGSPIMLPAGDVSVTLDAGFDWDRIKSDDTRTALPQTKLTRGDFNGGINVSVPIASRDMDVLAFLGNLTATFSAGADHLSDFGTLTDWTAGVTWSPFDKLTLQATRIVRDAAPGLSQLGAPTITNYNVPVYDFNTGQTVLAQVTSGGNPNLKRETQRDIRLGAFYELPLFDRTAVSVEYFRNKSNDVTASFPVLTPAIEAAFPGRVTRDGAGNLIALDQRPVTFTEQRSSRVRVGLNFSGQLGERPEGSQRGGGGGGGFAVGFGGPGGPGGPGGGALGGGAPGGGGGPPPFIFFGGAPGGGQQGGGGGNFNPQAFQKFREQLCADGGETPDISGLPEQMQERIKGPDGKPDPERLAEMRQRMCGANGQGGPGAVFNPEGFQRLQAAFCENGKPKEAPELSVLPEEFRRRFMGPDGVTPDMERVGQLQQRLCAANPAQFGGGAPSQGSQPGQGGGQGAPGSQPGQGNGGGQPQQGAAASGGFPFNRNRGGNFGRWNLSVNYTRELENEVLVASGGPLLDLLDGDALSGGGVSKNTFEINGGVFYNGMGVRLRGNYSSKTRVDGSGLPGSTDLYFDDLFTLNLRVFADLGRREKLVEQVPFLEGTRVSFSIDNLTDAHQRVTDSSGDTPLRYQPLLIDPLGRTLSLEFRKLF